MLFVARRGKLPRLIYDLICYNSLFGFMLVTAERMRQIQRGIKTIYAPTLSFFPAAVN